MTAIWLLSTRGRPKEAQATIDACEAAGMTSPAVVYVDETPYPKLRLPKNWILHYEREWRSLQGSLQWVFENFPAATSYGWLADDTRPRTKHWDRKLEDAAGDWCLAYAKDLWFSEDPGELEQLERGYNLSSGLCWGGDLVRAVGWWALPGVRQAGIDTAWTEIVRPLGLHRYVADVTVEHLHWRTKKRPRDDGDSWERNGDAYIERDIATRNEWVWSSAYRQLLLRLSRTVPDVDPPTRERVTGALRQSIVDELWSSRRSGIPAARLETILRGEVDAFIYEDLDSHANPGPA